MQLSKVARDSEGFSLTAALAGMIPVAFVRYSSGQITAFLVPVSFRALLFLVVRFSTWPVDVDVHPPYYQ